MKAVAAELNMSYAHVNELQEEIKSSYDQLLEAKEMSPSSLSYRWLHHCHLGIMNSVAVMISLRSRLNHNDHDDCIPCSPFSV